MVEHLLKSLCFDLLARCQINSRITRLPKELDMDEMSLFAEAILARKE